MATYQGQALLNYPDSFGQFYQSTPSIPPMKTALGWETDYSSPSSTPKPNVPENYYNYHNSLYESSTEHMQHDNDDDTEFDDYYYDAEQLVTASPEGGNVNMNSNSIPQLQQQYVDDYSDMIRVKERRPPAQDKVYNPKVGKADPDDYNTGYGQNDLDNRIRKIRKNDDIFRQGGGDLSTFANYALSAMKVLSLILSVVDGSGGSGPSNSERIDVGPPTAPTSEIDVALGTLMAFGGKYLRSIAMYAWEHATQTPAEPLGAAASPPTTVQVQEAPAQEAVVVEPQLSQEIQQPQSMVQSGTPYLSTLPAQQLEDLGLKAVAAGAEPLKLQQAFAAAQLNGDWSQLELEMAAVLGPEAVGLNANVGSGATAPANNVVAQMQDYVSGPVPVSTSSISVSSPVPISSSTSSVAPSGLGYYMAVANNYADRLTKVINGPDPSAPNSNNLSEDDQIAQQSIVTRFIKEFELEQEALALQYQANSIIRQVNNFIEGTPSEKVDNFGGNVDDQDVFVGGSAAGASSSGGGGGIGQFLSSIPNMVGQAAVSVIRFITPVAPQQIEEKVDGPSGPSGVSFSEVSPTVDLDTVTYAALGAGAIGTVLYGIYAASGTDDNRRTSKYKRSISSNVNIVAAEKQYSQLPYPLKHRSISAVGKKLSKPQKTTSNSAINSLLSTAIGLGVGGMIFYGTLSDEKSSRRSNVVAETTMQTNEQMLSKSIRKYSKIDFLH